MAWCRTDCKVALNWSVALSYEHVLCARLFITWTTLITHPTLHFYTLYRHTKARQNCTSWQWCSFIFSTRVNLLKQDGPKIYKYHAGIPSWDRGRTPLLVLYTGFIQHVAIQLHNALGYFQIDRNQDKQRKGEKYRTTTDNKKEQRKQ